MQRACERYVKRWPRIGCALVLGLWAVGRAAWTEAGEIAFGAGYVGEYTDNIRRVPDLPPSIPQEEWVNSGIAGVGYRSNSPEFAALIQGQVDYRNYHQKSYPDETLFYLDAGAIWSIQPRRFLWTLEDRYDQLPLVATLAATPDNREEVNVFRTGPDFIFPLSPVDDLVIGARAGSVLFKESHLDNYRYTGMLRWQHKTGPTTIFSLNYEIQQTEYTDMPTPVPPDGFSSQVRHDAYLRIDRREAVTRLLMDLGATHIRPDNRNEISGPLARLIWLRRISSESAWGFAGAMEFQDVGSALLATVSDPTAPEPIIPVMAPPLTSATSADIYFSRRAEMFYNQRGSLTAVYGRVFRREVDYEVLDQDRTESGASFMLTYNLSATLSVIASGDAVNTDYLLLSRNDEDRAYSLGLSYRISPYLTLGLEGRRFERASSDPLMSYEETRGFLSLVYTSGAAYVPLIRR